MWRPVVLKKETFFLSIGGAVSQPQARYTAEEVTRFPAFEEVRCAPSLSLFSSSFFSFCLSPANETYLV